MGSRFLLALFLVLLVLGCEVQAAQQLQQDDPGSPALLGKVQESISSYWDTAKAAAQDLYQRTYLTSVDEKLRKPLNWRDASVCKGTKPENTISVSEPTWWKERTCSLTATLAQ